MHTSSTPTFAAAPVAERAPAPLDAAAVALGAGRLCLDFANTAEWHASDRPVETLYSYANLLTWSQQAGVLDADSAAALLAAATAQPERAASVLARAVRLREALYRIFSALARGASALPDDLAILNGALAEAHNRLRLSANPGGFAWFWTGADDALERMLWPIARSAGELLTGPEVARGLIRECAGHPCGWLFLDASRNHSRRWCSMAGCGNRANARRHYERAKAAGTLAVAHSDVSTPTSTTDMRKTTAQHEGGQP